jgi:hypothetical protein
MVLNQGSCKSNKQTITTTTNPVRIKGKPYIETSILYLPKKNPYNVVVEIARVQVEYWNLLNFKVIVLKSYHLIY